MKLLATGKVKWFVYQKVVIVFIVFLIPLISMNIWVNYKGMSFTKNTILDSSWLGRHSIPSNWIKRYISSAINNYNFKKIKTYRSLVSEAKV